MGHLGDEEGRAQPQGLFTPESQSKGKCSLEGTNMRNTQGSQRCYTYSESCFGLFWCESNIFQDSAMSYISISDEKKMTYFFILTGNHSCLVIKILFFSRTFAA